MLLIVLVKSNQSDVEASENHKDTNKRLWLMKKTALSFHHSSFQCAMKYLLMAGQD